MMKYCEFKYVFDYIYIDAKGNWVQWSKVKFFEFYQTHGNGD